METMLVTSVFERNMYQYIITQIKSQQLVHIIDNSAHRNIIDYYFPLMFKQKYSEH